MRDKKQILLAGLFVLLQLAGLLIYGSQLWILIFSEEQVINWVFYEFAQVAAFFALLLGVIAGLWLFKLASERTKVLEGKVEAAGGRFHDVIIDQFKKWGLSEAESEIGMLLIKGMSIAEIADLRGRSQATIKAQNSAIYQKSGMNNRAQLVSYFVEELTSGF